MQTPVRLAVNFPPAALQGRTEGVTRSQHRENQSANHESLARRSRPWEMTADKKRLRGLLAARPSLKGILKGAFQA